MKHKYWGKYLCVLGILLFVFIAAGCGKAAETSKSPALGKETKEVEESRWLIIGGGESAIISLDKRSITKTSERGSDVSKDSTKYKVIDREIVSCWIKIEPKEGYKDKFLEQINKNYPKKNITALTHGMEYIKFDMLSREYMSVEEICFDGRKEILREKISDKWEKIVPNEGLYEIVFEEAKKQLGIK